MIDDITLLQNSMSPVIDKDGKNSINKTVARDILYNKENVKTFEVEDFAMGT